MVMRIRTGEGVKGWGVRSCVMGEDDKEGKESREIESERKGSKNIQREVERERESEREGERERRRERETRG